MRQRFQRRHAVGHVVGAGILRAARGRSRAPSCVTAIRSRQTFLSARRPALCGVRAVRAAGIHPLVSARQRGSRVCVADRDAQVSGARQRPRRDRRRGRSRGRCRLRSAARASSAMKAGSMLVVAEDRAERRHQALVVALGLRRCAAPRHSRQQRHRQRLHRLPAVERIGIVGGEEAQIVRLDRQRQFDRRGEAAVERRDRPLGDAGEDESLARLPSAPARRASSGRPSSVSGRSAPSLPTRPKASGITIGCLLGWSGVGGIVCVMSSR